MDVIDIPLVFVDRTTERDRTKFKSIVTNGKLEDLTGIPIDADCNVYETVSNEEVIFTTTCVGKPHIVRISYHPNWRVEGADRVYLVSPSFMLIFPDQENVKLYYGSGFIDNVGFVLSVIGIAICFFYGYKFYL